MRGRFITFEGGEGSGKSTQARLLADRLKAAGHDVLVTREPGGSPGAEAIRHVLLSGAAKPLGADAEAILFAAARADHVRTRIEPTLRSGTWVICDRFADSTRVYQGVLGKVDPRFISGLERIAVEDTRPDLTFILDLPPHVGLKRAARRRGSTDADRFESEKPRFHAKLRAAYRTLAKNEPQRCIVIDAAGKPDVVAKAVWGAVVKRFGVPEAASMLADAVS